MKNKKNLELSSTPHTALNFNEVERRAGELADLIENRYQELIDILLEYESFEVAEDETSRTLDLLRNIRENKKYFRLRTGPITSFLPRNQPLYAFTCFVIIPSLMANEVHFRIPHTTKHFFPKILKLLDIYDFFPNIHVSTKERLEFLKERSAVLENPQTGESIPVTDVVIFTGTFSNAYKLRLVFDKRTLFILNGSGHNPVVVSKDANLEKAVEAVTTLQFYNQGQDCAAPNSILVHKNISKNFMKMLREKTKAIQVGKYRERLNRVGPLSDPKDLIRVQKLFIENLEWIDRSTPGNISTKKAIVSPTIIFKPLSEGGNYQEIFAPIIFVQEYERDQELKNYFESPRYEQNAMYITLFGTSNYIESQIGKSVNGRVLHDESTLLHNTHLHATGVERGTKQYGGYGFGASSVSINGKLIAMPTLPQRDIYEWFVRPLLRKKSSRPIDTSKYTQIVHKNVRKLLQIKIEKIPKKEPSVHGEEVYIDTKQIEDSNARYVKVSNNKLYSLLGEPNVRYLAMLEIKEIKLIQKLLVLLQSRPSLSFDQFESDLYAIPKEKDANKRQNQALQKRFFQNVYQLLFGRNDGPRLAEFLWKLEDSKVNKLLNILNIQDK